MTKNNDIVVNNDRMIANNSDEARMSMDKEILEILDVSSYSHRILASYQARKYAYGICKSQYGKPNYKDYVEMLMRINCPDEFEKAEIGRKYRIATRLLIFMPWFFMIFVPVMLSLKSKHKKICKKKVIKSLNLKEE